MNAVATRSEVSRGNIDDTKIAHLEGLLGIEACRRLGIFRLPADFLLSVVVPIYNERHTLHQIVTEIRRSPLPKEIILVDDGSTDGTRELLENYRQDADVTVVSHERNQGKGAAVRTGFKYARGTVVIVQDADMEYSPAEYPRLVQPIVDGRADAVYGSRFLGDGPHRVLYYWHYLGNRLLTTLSNMTTNLNLTDMETCYKAVRGDLLATLVPSLRQNRFGFEPELTAKLARRRARLFEVSISYAGRTYEEGKKIGWRDGLQAFWCIIRYAIAD